MDKPYSIAIVGLGGVFPDATDVRSFWENIKASKDSCIEVPAERWVDDPNWFSSRDEHDRVASKRVCLLEKTPEPRSQLDEPLDDLCKMTLAAAEMAVDDAKVALKDRSRVATILASIALPTTGSSRLSEEFFLNTLAQSLDPAPVVPDLSVFPEARDVTARPAQVVAKGLGLGGFTLTLDAACASSLYAVKLACDALTDGRVDAVLAGGANRADTLYTQEGFTALGACSDTGRCSPFDRNGDGLVVGEGAGFLLLKRVEDAVADGDRVYAVIRGIGLSNDVGGSLLAPDSEGQQRALEMAYQQTGWKPEAVGLVECHGTGTPKGDSTEFHSLTSFWPKTKKKTTVLGSVKSQIGHLLTGAGAAGLIKVIMALNERVLPPMINFKNPAKGIDLDNSPFEILSEPRAWEQKTPLRAGVSAFGFGGINGHVLLEEPHSLEAEVAPKQDSKREVVITSVGVKMGQKHDLSELLSDTLSGEHAATERPDGRWGTESAVADELSSVRGAYLDELEIVPGSMRIPPKDLGDVLLQQSLLLAVARDATQKSQLGDKKRCRRSGALIGLSLDLETTNYHLRWALGRMLNKLGVDPDQLSDAEKEELRDTLSRPLDSTRTLGALGSIVASRAAREFSLGGPSYAISCGEASGIRALEIGARAIAEGEMDSCLIGAIDLAGDPRSVWTEDQLHFYSRSERARPFSEDGDGPTLAEGAVVLVLKSREAAELDGDRILAVLEDGVSTFGDESLSRILGNLQNPPGFVDLLSRAKPQEDRKLIAALSKAELFGQAPTALGTATAQVGLAGACSGLLSVARSVMALDHKILPSMGDCRQPMDTGEKFFLPREAAFWWHDFERGPRRALALGQGRGGDAYGLLLREDSAQAPGIDSYVRAQNLPAQLFCIPPGRLQELQELAASNEDIVDLAFVWSERIGTELGLGDEGGRAALVVRDMPELRRGLQLLERGVEENTDFNGQAGAFHCSKTIEGETAWVFPGSGNHYLGMGRELATLFPQVAAEVCSEADLSFQHYTPWLTQPYHSDRGPGWEAAALQAIENDPLAPIFSQVTYAILAARVLSQFLPQPQAAIGYSLGETAALFSMGAWSARDEMFCKTMESPLFARQLRAHYEAPRQVLGLSEDDAFEWRVAVINRNREVVEEAIAKLAHKDLSLLIVNTPNECVVGGQAGSVEELVELLDSSVFYLDGVPTVHCALMHPVQEAYRELHRLPTKAPKNLRFYNGHRAKSYKPSRESAAESITENALYGFSFPKLIEQSYKDGARKFIEIGPGGSCARMVGAILEDREHWARSVSLPREGGETLSLLRVLAGAYVQGSELELSALYWADERRLENTKPVVKVKAGESLAKVLSKPIKIATPEPPRVKPSPVRPSPAPALNGKNGSAYGNGTTPKPSPIAAKIEPQKPASAIAQLPSAGQTKPSARPSAGGRALVWVGHQPTRATTLTKDNKIMSQQEQQSPSMLQPVIGLHPDYQGDPAARVAASIVESTRQTALAQESYLELMNKTREQMESLLRRASMGEAGLDTDVMEPVAYSVEQVVEPTGYQGVPLDPTSANPVMRGERPHRDGLAFDRDMCMEFAIGSVANVLGERFRPVDDNSVRVRLPDEPLMLCDRILSVEGEPCSLGSGRLTTEHDVFPESWYLDHDRAPVCISVEAGQADLFLCSYLGIDLATDGTRAYRLLDATVSFHRGLPQPGETILYDIRINKFVRQGEVYLFFFEFDGTINGEPLITMRNGCAGFHTYEEIAASGGIVLTPQEKAPAQGKTPLGWAPLAPFPHGMDVSESYSDAQVAAFRNGDLAGCFGAGFDGLPLSQPYGLPKGRMKLFDRVLNLEPRGGRFGLGRVQAEADIHPDDWFLTCHFKDDMVMPGTLMYECCAHSLRFLLARLGWVAEAQDVHFEPRLNTPAKLCCRGPVTVETKKVLYQVDIKEIGFDPEPYVITDALMFGDGKQIVRFVDMSMKLTGIDENYLKSIWGQAQQVETQGTHVPYLNQPALYDKESIMQFSNGRPSLAFGPEYTVFDNERRIARLPGPPYQFMDRVVEADHPKFVLQKGGWIEAHYDVPPDEWYFAANRQDSMAYCILLEAALQPCGWLAAYAGSALRSDSDVKFRNLGGTAKLIKEVFPHMGTIRMRVRMTDVNEAGGMIIENFDMLVYAGDELIYEGTTYFGFFSAQALAKQVGVRDAAERTYIPTDADWASFQPEVIPVEHPLSPEDLSMTPAAALNMPGKALLMMDQVDIFLPHSGGTKGIGFIQGSKIVDPDEWFFKAHFYQDPVWPGSLGLEAFMQLLRYAAIRYWPEYQDTHRFEAIALDKEHTWAYRGQVIPTNKQVIVDVSIVEKVDGECPLLVGSGFLRVDGTPIYEMTEFALRLVPIG